MKETEIQEHYRRIAPVTEALADVDGYLTLGSNDHYGWYVKRDNDDPEMVEKGYPQKGRPATFAHDYETVSERIERTLYAITSYKDRDVASNWQPCYYANEANETRWEDDENPMPGYGAIRGMMAWGDIDLLDELKPERGNLEDVSQQVIEATLSAYIEEFSKLYGSRDAIFALDSVGGAYVMGAPSATIPIADNFRDDEDALARVMEEFVSRSNDWLEEAQERVESRVEAASSVIDPDWVNNCNRKYKAPLSLHSDHDAVVTPLDTGGVQYDLTPVGDVDDELIESAVEWAEDFTSTEYRDCVDALVENLWPEEYDEDGEWFEALEAWVEAEREAEREEQRRLEEARKRREERRKEMEGIEGLPITPFIGDVYSALDDLDVEAVAEDTIVHQWTDQASDKTDTSGSGKRAFVPTWGSVNSGTANYINLEKGTFVDSGDNNKHGTAVEMALLAHDNWTKGDIASGSDWAKGVDILRDLGYEIPVWTPEAGSKKTSGGQYEQMPYWAVRKAAVALSILPEDAFVPKQDETGGYLAFPGKDTYNRALAAIEDAGLNHGREYMTDDGSRPSEEELGRTGLDDESNDADDSASDVTEQDGEPVERDEPEPDSEAGGSEPAATPSTASVSETTSASDAPPGRTVTGGNMLEYENGGYGYWKTNQSGESYFVEVTNFELEAESFLRAERGNEIQVQMKVWPSGSEPPYEITVPMEVFNDGRRFRDKVVLGRTTTFEGGQSELNDLRTLVGSQDAPERDGTHHMGLHRDEFVTPNGVLRADGWTDDPTHVYQERNIDTERAWALSPEEHTDYDPEEVVDILELAHQTRHAERILPVLGWFYSAPLRPFIQDEEGQFNHLHIRGGTGAGKSSTVETLTRMFGMDGSGKKVDSTVFTLMAAMASSNAVPIWFDEYKPGDIESWRLDKFQNFLRLNTKWEYDTRGNADKSTEEYHLRAPIVITGEQAIQGSAEERRSLQVAFRDDVKGAGNPMNRAFAELAGLDWDEADNPDAETHHFEGRDLSEHALAFYRFILTLPTDDLRETWRESRDHIRRVLAGTDVDELDDLPRQGLQTIHFGMTIYRAFAKAMLIEAESDMELADLNLPTEDDVDAAIIYAAEEMGGRDGRESHLDQFLSLATRAAAANYLEEGQHYKFVHEGEASEELRMNLSQSFDKISQYVKDHDIDSEDFLNRAKDYRDRMKEQVEQGDGYMVEHSVYTAGINQACGIHVETAEDRLEEFSKAMWSDSVEIEDPEAEEHADAEPLWKTSPGYRTLTVEVKKLDGDTPDSVLLSGQVEDRSGVVDLIQWARADADAFDLEEGECYRFENARMGTDQDSALQVELVSGVTKIRKITPGTGTLNYADAGDNATLDEPERASTDGGTTTTTATTASDETDGGDDDDAEAVSSDEGSESESGDDVDVDVDVNEPSESSEGEDGALESKRATAKEVQDLIIQHVTAKSSEGEAGAPRDVVVEALVEKGIKEQRAEDRISEMLRKSRGIYEPLEGELAIR